MSHLTVIYDGRCKLCTASVGALRRLDWLERLDYLDADDWPTVHTHYPLLARDALLEAMHVINAEGRAFVGFYGFRRLAHALPLLWPIVPLLYLPGVPPLGVRVYRFIASRRARRLCDDGACPMHH